MPNIKTVERYFNILLNISFEYYQDALDTTFFKGDIELDETLLFREKKSKAKHRSYQLGKIWVFGIRKRLSKEFLIIPVVSRTEEKLHSIILKYVSLDSTLYTDCYSAYVNNKVFPKESKLVHYGYSHQFVNHTEEFVSQIFPQIHTNTVERLWKELKKDVKMKHTRHKYLLHIGRFVFMRSLEREKQLRYIAKKLNIST